MLMITEDRLLDQASLGQMYPMASLFTHPEHEPFSAQWSRIKDQLLALPALDDNDQNPRWLNVQWLGGRRNPHYNYPESKHEVLVRQLINGAFDVEAEAHWLTEFGELLQSSDIYPDIYTNHENPVNTWGNEAVRAAISEAIRSKVFRSKLPSDLANQLEDEPDCVFFGEGFNRLAAARLNGKLQEMATIACREALRRSGIWRGQRTMVSSFSLAPSWRPVGYDTNLITQNLTSDGLVSNYQNYGGVGPLHDLCVLDKAWNALITDINIMLTCTRAEQVRGEYIPNVALRGCEPYCKQPGRQGVDVQWKQTQSFLLALLAAGHKRCILFNPSNGATVEDERRMVRFLERLQMEFPGKEFRRTAKPIPLDAKAIRIGRLTIKYDDWMAGNVGETSPIF